MSHNIAKIIYINLERRLDRLHEITEELTTISLEGERFNAIPNSNGIVGCGYSHLEVLKLAKQRGYKNILILEDDFTFLIPKEEFEKELTMLFEKEIQFDVCMLAYNLMESETIVHTPFLKRVLSAQTASAYIVNSTYYDTLINLYNVAIPLLEKTGQHWIYANDQIWKRLQRKDNWVCFTTRIGKQRASYSDNGQSYVDYNC
jgi:GR25 family glycosyltransferase involved in LPS biosynthesis